MRRVWMNLNAKTTIKEKAEKYIKFECYNPFYFKYK